jgi:hypothetical protein
MMGTFSINKVAAYRLNLPGPNARVNISSMDNLTNIVQFFAELGNSAVRLSGAALRRCSKQTVKNGHPDKKLTAKKFVAGWALQLSQHQASPYLMDLCVRKRAPWLSLAKKTASEEAAWGRQ